MLVKLYKQIGDLRFYWEAWESEGQAVFHTGELGTRGTTERATPEPGQSVTQLIEIRTEAESRKGFEPVGRDKMKQIVLSCPVASDWTSEDVLGVARYLEDLCNDCLGWSGLGHCDGPAYGKQQVSVFSLVVDQTMGIEAIIAELQRHGCEGKDEELVLSVPDEAGYRIVYTTGPARI